MSKYHTGLEEEKSVSCISLDLETDWDGIHLFSKRNFRVVGNRTGHHCRNEGVKLCNREHVGAIFLFRTIIR